MWGSLMALRPWVEGKLQLAHGDLLGYKPPFPHFPRAPTRGGQAEAESWPAFVMWSTQMNLSEPEQGSDRICSSQQKIPEQKAKTLPTFPFFFFSSGPEIPVLMESNSFHYNHFYFCTGHFRIFPPTFFPSSALCCTPYAANLTEGLSQVHSATRC